MTAPAPRRHPHLVQAAQSPPSPHPTGGRVVGRYVRSYDPAPRAPYPTRIPAMRPAQEAVADARRASLTPIYDALCAEYRRLFRALPGDRSGEEDLGFVGFGALPVGGTGLSRGLTSTGYGRTGGPAAFWEPGERPRPAYLPAVLPPASRAPQEQPGRGY
jgi:hypothetical protein